MADAVLSMQNPFQGIHSMQNPFLCLPFMPVILNKKTNKNQKERCCAVAFIPKVKSVQNSSMSVGGFIALRRGGGGEDSFLEFKDDKYKKPLFQH